ncbi:hypothetical protein STCU_06492 [Strigomonas culicis]|uniref:Uncharacterized protein n=1 Tax=Strigomonas culicis TaxID=28005 RepID=S9UAH7_9TRYP|nr:hypothetical protein STCU_06492 [Strigomonas culicis]|eukprot:EPY25754.1 hypothetical protein STCU_06492 [Strigomonas culicis]
MIRTQCSAYCQCDFCKQRTDALPGEATCRLQLTGATVSSKDALYYQSLKSSMKAQSMQQSLKNASRFIPDEQLLSSQKKRDAKDCALLATSVPLRRRDHLEELLLLENKARLLEERRLRAERRALGLPVSDASTPAEATTPVQKPRTPVSEPGGAAAAACSAEHDLQHVLGRIRAIAAAAPAGETAPLTPAQITELRGLVRAQEERSRQQVAACPHAESHICDHCMSINVQARHLCPQLADSTAFAQTGKVINQDEGIYYGTAAPRLLDGTYDPREGVQLGETLTASQKRLGDSYNTHPYGSGLVFLPLGDSSKQREQKNVTFKADTPSAQSTPKVAGAQAPPTDSSMDKFKTTSSMWQSTSQSCNAEMKQFMESQKKLQEKGRKVYNNTAAM